MVGWGHVWCARTSTDQSGEGLPGQVLQVVPGQVQHLRLRVDVLGDRDQALAAALHVTLA